jgi:hypothetical protein
MSFPLPGFADERFLQHRRRASSNAGIACAMLALLLFAYRFYHDHAVSVDLLAVVGTFLVVKYVLFFRYRRTD